MSAPTEPVNQFDVLADHRKRYPGYSADPETLKLAQNHVWQDLRDLRNGSGEPYTDTQALIYALNQFEQRSRKFLRGAVLWITIGAPILWGVIWFLVTMLALAVRTGP